MKTKAIEAYIVEKNRWNHIFQDSKDLTLTDLPEITKELAIDMSPENMSCDGELRGSKLRARANKLNKVAAELLALGHDVNKVWENHA